MCPVAKSLSPQHGSAAKTPFQSAEPAETESTSLEADRLNEGPSRQTSASGNRTPSKVGNGNRFARDPNNSPIPFGAQIPYQYQVPVMVPPFEMFPGQYQEMMMDHMKYGGRYLPPYYGFSDFGSPGSDQSYTAATDAHSRNNEKPADHSRQCEDSANSTAAAFNASYPKKRVGPVIPPEPITSEKEFNSWVKKFAYYLEKINLKDIIPNSVGIAKRKPTRCEIRILERTFHENVSPEFYPPWVRMAIDRGLSMPEIINTAFEKIVECEDNFDSMRRLISLRYDGRYDPRVYINEVKKAIAEWEEDGNTLTPRAKAKLLSQGLRGDYRTIHSQLNVGKIEADIHVVDKEILSIYTTKMEVRTTDDRIIQCSICDKRDHVAKYCNKKPETTRDEYRPTKSQYSSKKRDANPKKPTTQKSWTKSRAKANYVRASELTPAIESAEDHTDEDNYGEELRPERFLY